MSFCVRVGVGVSEVQVYMRVSVVLTQRNAAKLIAAQVIKQGTKHAGNVILTL